MNKIRNANRYIVFAVGAEIPYDDNVFENLTLPQARKIAQSAERAHILKAFGNATRVIEAWYKGKFELYVSKRGRFYAPKNKNKEVK